MNDDRNPYRPRRSATPRPRPRHLARLFLAAAGVILLTADLGAATPVVSGVSPSAAPPSGQFLVSGSGFGATRGTSIVEIGATAAFVTRWTDTEIVAYVPGLTTPGATGVRVVTASGSSNTVPFTVLTLPAPDGRVAWRFTMDASYALHRPAVAPDGTVYVQDIRGFLYALDSSGRLLWIYDAAGWPSGGGGDGPVALFADGTIVVVGDPLGPDVQIHGVNPDGTLRWVFTDTNTQGVIAGPSVGPDDHVYFVTDIGGLGLVSLSSAGGLLWSDPGSPNFLEYGQLGEEIVFDPPLRQLYCAFDEYGLDSDRLFGFTLDGDQRFASATGAQSTPLGQSQGQPTVGPDGTVYLCSFLGGWRLAAYDPSDGARVWTHFPVGTNLLTEPDAGPDGTVYVGRNLGELYAIAPDGSERWVRTTTEIFFGPIASPANDVVLAGGRITYGAPGWLKALSVTNGSVEWTVDFPDEGGLTMIPFSRPKFSADGARAYISTTLLGQVQGDEHSYLYAIDVGSTPTAVAELSGANFAGRIVASPNPFRTVTELSFESRGREGVSLRVLDVAGRVVRRLHAGELGEGAHRFVWDGRNDAGRGVPSGVYFVRLTSAREAASAKLVRAR